MHRTLPIGPLELAAEVSHTINLGLPEVMEGMRRLAELRADEESIQTVAVPVSRSVGALWNQGQLRAEWSGVVTVEVEGFALIGAFGDLQESIDLHRDETAGSATRFARDSDRRKWLRQHLPTHVPAFDEGKRTRDGLAHGKVSSGHHWSGVEAIHYVNHDHSELVTRADIVRMRHALEAAQRAVLDVGWRP